MWIFRQTERAASAKGPDGGADLTYFLFLEEADVAIVPVVGVGKERGE